MRMIIISVRNNTNDEIEYNNKNNVNNKDHNRVNKGFSNIRIM